MTPIANDGAVSMLECMMLIRAYEEKLAAMHAAGNAAGTCTSVGQEASAVGVVRALTADDRILTNHRSAGHLLARGYVPGDVPEGEHLVPLGKAAVKREGSDVTIVSYAKMVGHCLQAAEALAAQGVSAEVIDLRSLKPLDEEAILRSARKTGRVLVVHEASRMCGVGAEVAAIISEQAFDALKAPVVRITGPDAPAPSSYMLEQAFMPQPDAIVSAALKLTGKTATAEQQEAIAA